jgi:hypothetical protein
LIGANKFANGSFNSNVNGVMVNSSPGVGTGTFNSGGKLDGGALQVSFDASSGATNNVGTHIDFGAVTAGKTYLIRFSLLSAAPGKTLKGFVLQNGGSYGRLSETRFFELSTTRTENEFLFTATSTETNVMIALELGGRDCPFWLDNFQVFEANITLNDPNDYMRFEYNGTSKSKTVLLSGNYVDAKNQAYTGSVTINPYSSVILIKKTSATTTQAAARTITELTSATEMADIKTKETTEITVKVSPNPAHEKLQVAISLPASTQSASMSIYSLSGVKLKTLPLSAATSIVPVDVSSLNSGVYIINIVHDGQVTTRKFVKQ